MELRDKNGLTEQEFLAAYRPGKYERPSLTADIAVFIVEQERLRLLLVKRGGHPYLGCWALPGGFAKKDESVDETAARELEEETGLAGLPLAQVGLFSKPGRDPRMWVASEAFVSVIPPERIQETRAGDDAADARWFDVERRQENNRITLLFSSGDVSFQAELQRKAALLGAYPSTAAYTVTAGGGLAFDHGEIIAAAMDKIGLL